MADGIATPRAEYDALLGRHPWIASRDPFAYMSKGWSGLVGTTLDAMDPMMAGQPGATVTGWHTKEKFGGMRISFAIEGASDADALWEAMRVPAEAAENASLQTCEACGAPGRLRDAAGWWTTRCDAHAPEGSRPA